MTDDRPEAGKPAQAAEPLALRLDDQLGAPAMNPPLPTPAVWNCYWKGDNDGPSWDQWHDASDPMPERWDGDPPDDVVPYFTSTQVFEYAGQCVREATTECSAHWQAALDAAVATERERCAKLCEEDAFVDQWRGLAEAARRIRGA